MSIVCPTCDYITDEWGHKYELASGEFPILERNPSTLTCDEGHSFIYTSENLEYELIYFYALQAFRQKFYREAIMSAAASFENFQGVVIKSMSFWTTAPNQLRGNNLEKAMKTTLKLSERRNGAYTLICALEGKEAPSLDSNSVGLRNNCAHNGYYPTEIEAYNFIAAVHALIKEAKQIGGIGARLVLFRDSLIGVHQKSVNLDSTINVYGKFDINNFTFASTINDTNNIPLWAMVEKGRKLYFS